MNKYGYFEEIDVILFPEIEKCKYPDYYMEDSMLCDRLFKYENLYCELCLDDGIPFISMINIGDKPVNLLKVSKIFLQEILNEYKSIGFEWTLEQTGKFLSYITKQLSYSYKEQKLINDKIHSLILLV